jgi:Mn2+/Fe2+ NRAMP family transporter
MGNYRNGPLLNAVSWGVTLLLIALTAMMLWLTVVE